MRVFWRLWRIVLSDVEGRPWSFRQLAYPLFAIVRFAFCVVVSVFLITHHKLFSRLMTKLLLEKFACRARHHLRVLAFLFQEILLYLISSRLLLYLRLRARYKHEHLVSGGPILGILVQAATDNTL